MTLFTAVAFASAVAALCAANETKSVPYAWAYLSSAVWAIWFMSKGWTSLHFWDKAHLLWGASSIFALCKFTQATVNTDDPFEGWSDIYFFCGSNYRYCRCDFTWNLQGWIKALVLWNFVVTACLSVQKLVIHAGLNGLLPGEEVVTKESLVSFCWRLIPYWLNSWEQQWGAECSSVMFELPHFALELLVVLPCVQIMSSRLKILMMPPGRGVVPPFDQNTPEEAANMSPVIMTGVWEDRKADHDFCGRLRANFRVLTLIVTILGLAAFNAMYVPLHLEQVIHSHPRSAALLAVAQQADWIADVNSTHAGSRGVSPEMAAVVEAYMAKGCKNQDKLVGALAKHAQELARVQNPQYQDLTQCVEAALTIMRLSCEQYFTLISVFAAYLLFRQRVPPIAHYVVWVNHTVSSTFKKAILYSFPAICWLYGAGLMFSSFASLVFWGQPAAQLYEMLKTNFTIVHPVGLQDANEAQIEQMNNNCAVCWSPMTVVNTSGSSASAPSRPVTAPEQNGRSEVEEEEEQAGPNLEQDLPRGFMQLPFTVQGTAAAVDAGASAAAEEEDETAMEQAACKALPCGHAFHDSCIAKWLAQCYGQSRQPTCPMCNLVIKLQVSYQFSRRRSQAPLQQQQQQGNVLGQVPEQGQQPPFTCLNSAVNTNTAVQPQAAALAAAAENPEGSIPRRRDPLPSTTGQANAANTAVQGHTANWAISESLGGSTASCRDPLASTMGQRHAERQHHTSSMAPAPQRAEPNWNSWPHHNAGAAHMPQQDPCSLHDLRAESGPAWRKVRRQAQPHDSSAESAPVWHEVQRQGQPLQASMRPNSLWGFAASGVDLQHHPASSEHAHQGHAWVGHDGSSPARVRHVRSSREGSCSSVSDLLSHAEGLSYQQVPSSCSSEQSGPSDRAVSRQVGPQQDGHHHWMCVEQDVRQQQGRWAPARLVMTRAHRNRQEGRPHPSSSVPAQANFADAASASS